MTVRALHSQRKLLAWIERQARVGSKRLASHADMHGIGSAGDGSRANTEHSCFEQLANRELRDAK